MRFNNKEIEFYATASLSHKYGPKGITTFVHLAQDVLTEHPVDMLVFEPIKKDPKKPTVGTGIQIRLAGYFFSGEREGELEETKVITKIWTNFTDRFWLKIDDHGDKYVATFLYPSEY